MKKLGVILIGGTILAAVALLLIFGLPLLQNPGNKIEVVEAVKNIGEVALVQLSVVDIYDRPQSTNVPGIGTLWGSERNKYIKVKYDAKLGIDGTKVKITPTGEGSYEVIVPPFKFIGYDNFTSEVAAEKNGILSWTNPEIDSTTLINEVLSTDGQQKLLKNYNQQLKSSTEQFFTQLVRGMNPDAKITFVF